jgi:hypothetical protein
MWGLESAEITIHSPSGGYVRIIKWHMDKLNEAQGKLVWEMYSRSNVSNKIELTVDEMKQLVEIGHIAGKVYKPIPKQKSLAQRKFEWRKKNVKPNACKCGGTIIEKDHGKWIGWFCPKCKCGGSKNKRK